MPWRATPGLTRSHTRRDANSQTPPDSTFVQLGTDIAGENGSLFAVKKYHSELSTDLAVTVDGWRHTSLQLLPVNPAFEPIEIEAGQAADIVIVGECQTIAPQV